MVSTAFRLALASRLTGKFAPPLDWIEMPGTEAYRLPETDLLLLGPLNTLPLVFDIHRLQQLTKTAHSLT